ncbi:radical SAM protein [Brachyspira murdochii]|uniref:radical SAM protein n=1 Tax=Brachyspira murdochii TaxID=84378 RepID=UPI003005B0E4
MKWQDKGHEFDALGEIFKKNKDLLVIGNEESLKNIKKELDFLNTKIEYKTLKEVFNISILSSFKLKNKTIVISDNNQDSLEKLLKNKWLKLNENVFLAEDFLKKYLSIYAIYVYDKIYTGTGTCLILTTHCSLNCEYCLNYEPYIKNKKHRDFEELKSDVDTFFKYFDKVRYFSLSGGEPFLHPKFKEIIEYVGENYINKISEFGTVTNGSILPSDELLLAIKKYNMELVIDNYTKNAPYIKKTYEELIEKCKKININYITGGETDTVFFKSFPPKEDYTKCTEEELINKYSGCKKFYDGFDIKNKKLYSCCYSSFADTANLVKADENDFFDLDNPKDIYGGGYKKELIEFRLGYTKKGYVNFCKYCNGFPSINNEFDENGVTQLERGKILEWDINKE